MTKRELYELLAIDTLVIFVLGVKLQDWLLLFQIFAAMVAGIYTTVRLFQLLVKWWNGEL